jgi:allantoate deiminase
MLTDHVDADVGRRILMRCDELAAISAPGDGVTRLYLTEEHRRAIELVSAWMREAGMAVNVDSAANVIGRYHAETGGGPYLMLGSHIDSVVEGGKFDGPLGVISAIECVASFASNGRRLPFGVEVIAFGDEEGSRFGATLIGSRALTGRLTVDDLAVRDAEGISLAAALLAFGLDPSRIGEAAHDADECLAYVELHIEQGPVLEQADLPVGVVTAISAQDRRMLTLRNEPNHAGTVPMNLRHDPLLAGAEVALAVERSAIGLPDAVGTVGHVVVRPGALNVIPGEATLGLDLRARSDDVLGQLIAMVMSEIEAIAERRGVEAIVNRLISGAAAPCATWLIEQLDAATRGCGLQVLHLPSGAGHDGMAMIDLVPIAMIFVRCRKGISHSPLESVEPADVAAAYQVLRRFVERFAPAT